MGDTWITNLRHLLDQDGALPVDLPDPAARLARYFGSIVEAVTGPARTGAPLTGIRCRRRPRHKPCPGQIIAFIDAENDSAIDWHCPVCGDNGLLSGWQNTTWDLTPRA